MLFQLVFELGSCTSSFLIYSKKLGELIGATEARGMANVEEGTSCFFFFRSEILPVFVL